MRALPLLPALSLLLAPACSDDGGGGGGTDAASANATITLGGITNLTTPTGGDSESTAATEGVTGTTGATGTPVTDGPGSAPDPKFDLAPVPDSSPPEPDEGCKKVDLLFVIDNSGSMADEQINLISSFPGFVAEMQSKLVNTESYHVGIITSDSNQYNGPGCNFIGALVNRTGGANSSNAVCGPYAAGKNWMSEADDLATKFACAGQVGTGGSGNEQPMYAMLQAVHPQYQQPGACNEGFIRPDALLVVVIITDEEDDHEVNGCNQLPQPGSPGEPITWFNDLVAIKDGIETNIVVLSLVGPVQPPCPALDKCAGGITGAEVATRIIQFTEMFTNGSIGQICAPSYQSFFSAAISLIDEACDNFIPPG